MEKLYLKEICEILNGECQNYLNIQIENISTDSRQKNENALFIPLKGDNFDGHDFINTAFTNGAIACISERKLNIKSPYILVNNSLNALHSLAKYYLDKINPYRIIITGSTGKTSTKDMLFQCLNNDYTVKTIGNMNNLIGVPLNIFNINFSTKTVVFEAGMNMKGELEKLSYILSPDTIIITSINNSHIGNFNSFEELINAKFEILKFWKNKKLIINGDNKEIIKKLPHNVKYKTFGLNKTNNYYPNEFILNENKSTIRIDNNEFKLNIPGIGAIYSFLAVYAFSKEHPQIEINIDNVSEFTPPSRRMNIINTENITIIDDTYNASPVSMKNAIDVLSKFSSRKVAILGDMLELGKNSIIFHKEIGNYLNNKNIDILISIGTDAEYYMKNFKNISYAYKNYKDAIREILNIITKKDIVLIKGSRAIQMDKITDYILENENAL